MLLALIALTIIFWCLWVQQLVVLTSARFFFESVSRVVSSSTLFLCMATSSRISLTANSLFSCTLVDCCLHLNRHKPCLQLSTLQIISSVVFLFQFAFTVYNELILLTSRNPTERTSRERHKSAPYLRLKNSKRTWKCQKTQSIKFTKNPNDGTGALKEGSFLIL